MALTFLKNKVTGEIRKIEAASEEYLELAAQRISDHLGDDNKSVYPDQSHRPLWEDRGVAGHAEADIEPVKGNVNDRDYDQSILERQGEADPNVNTDLELATGDKREQHATVHDSGTAATRDAEEGSSSSDKGSQGSTSGSQSGSAPQPAATT
jgi:hypothetical protein